MLYITRKVGETIIINNNIEVTIQEIKGGKVKIGCRYPKNASVLRKELHDKITQQNFSAQNIDKNNIPIIQELKSEEKTK